MAALENSREEQFAQNLVKGMTQRQAYLEAFPQAKNCKPETIDNKACKLAKKGEVEARMKELKDEAASDAILDRQGRMLILTEIATNDEMMPKARMQAIDILNKMDGDYVKRVEAVVTGDLSDTAAKVAAILDE